MEIQSEIIQEKKTIFKLPVRFDLSSIEKSFYHPKEYHEVRDHYPIKGDMYVLTAHLVEKSFYHIEDRIDIGFHPSANHIQLQYIELLTFLRTAFITKNEIEFENHIMCLYTFLLTTTPLEICYNKNITDPIVHNIFENMLDLQHHVFNMFEIIESYFKNGYAIWNHFKILKSAEEVIYLPSNKRYIPFLKHYEMKYQLLPGDFTQFDSFGKLMIEQINRKITMEKDNIKGK